MRIHLLAVFVVILLGFHGSALAIENKQTHSPQLAAGERENKATTGDSKDANEKTEPTVGEEWATYDEKRDNARKREVRQAKSSQESSVTSSKHKREGGSESSIVSSPERQQGVNASTTRVQRSKNAGASGSEQWRVLTARLKGSLCVSCLFHLERKIQALEGVTSAHIIRPAKVVDPVAEHPAHAQVQIVYNASKWNPKSIRSFIHRNDFDIKDEQDIELTADFKPLPDPNPLSDLQKNIGGVVNAQMKQPD
jgi:hypothetical protein